MIRELECLELQHPIISTFASRFLKIYFRDLLISRAYILGTSLNIQAGEGSCLDGAQQKVSASRFLNFWFLCTDFTTFLMPFALCCH